MIFFFNDTATTEIYTLSLHDALPILRVDNGAPSQSLALTAVSPAGSAYLSGTNLFYRGTGGGAGGQFRIRNTRSEEHTSELQSRQYLVCRLLLEKKKRKQASHVTYTT